MINCQCGCHGAYMKKVEHSYHCITSENVIHFSTHVIYIWWKKEVSFILMNLSSTSLHFSKEYLFAIHWTFFFKWQIFIFYQWDSPQSLLFYFFTSECILICWFRDSFFCVRSLCPLLKAANVKWDSKSSIHLTECSEQLLSFCGQEIFEAKILDDTHSGKYEIIHSDDVFVCVLGIDVLQTGWSLWDSQGSAWECSGGDHEPRDQGGHGHVPSELPEAGRSCQGLPWSQAALWGWGGSLGHWWGDLHPHLCYKGLLPDERDLEWVCEGEEVCFCFLSILLHCKTEGFYVFPVIVVLLPHSFLLSVSLSVSVSVCLSVCLSVSPLFIMHVTQYVVQYLWNKN